LNPRHCIADWIFLGVFIVIVGWAVGRGLTRTDMGGSRDIDRTPLNELIEGSVVQQNVPVHGIGVAGTVCYDVQFATYRRTNPCMLRVSLIQDEFHRSVDIDAANLKDNQFHPMYFPAKGLRKGVATLKIVSLNCSPGQSPTVWLTADIPFGVSVHNGNKLNKGLIFQSYTKKHFSLILIWLCGSLLICVAIMASVYFWYPNFWKCFTSFFHRSLKYGNSHIVEPLIRYREVILIFSLMAWTLATVMATVSRVGIHPDEGLHSVAATYYETHHTFPVVGDPEARFTYSNLYGVSYINQKGIDYYLIGKFSALIQHVVSLKGLPLHRLFNIFLFFALCCLIMRSDERLQYFPLIITPQVWYIASYTNNDFFPFFIMILICSELLSPSSWFNQAVQGRSLYNALPAGGFLGILAISKTNYIVFLAFLGFYLVWQIFQLNRFVCTRNLFTNRLVKATLILAACTVSIFVLRIGIDIFQNGFDKADKLMKYGNEVGGKGFRQTDLDTDLKNSYPGLRLKEKGVSLQELIIGRNWYNSSLNSFFGVYGKMTLKSSTTYYRWISLLFCALLLYISVHIVIDSKKENLILLGGALFFIVLMICASIYNSWTYDFQPQGRYLFPILGILSVLFHRCKDCLNRNVLWLLICVMFLSSFWSFLYVGIAQAV